MRRDRRRVSLRVGGRNILGLTRGGPYWSGLMWLMYRETGARSYRDIASFKLTGNARSRRRAMTAASLLSSRYNLKGRFIRAWNDDRTGWAIVDCLMNLPILYWASGQAKDERFADVARGQVATAIRSIQRPDGSMNHIVSFDPETGEAIESIGRQGYGVGSSWSRGKAWGTLRFRA